MTSIIQKIHPVNFLMALLFLPAGCPPRQQNDPPDLSIGVSQYESPCVNDLMAQLGESPLLNIRSHSKSFRLSDPVSGIYGPSYHNQGIGMLSDILVSGERYTRAVLSFTANDETGFVVVSKKIPGGESGFTADPNLISFNEEKHVLDIQKVPGYGNHNHPGGLQAHGNYVAIAMESPLNPDNRAAVYFLRVEKFEAEHIYTHFIGTNTDHIDAAINSASSVGFVKLETGGFLMAVSGEDHGRQGIWFYNSPDSTINSGMSWDFIDYWDPMDHMPNGICDTGGGEVSNNCFIGGGGGTSLITGCDGQIYMVLLTGTAQGGVEDEFVQIMRVNLEGSPTRTVRLTSIWNDKHKLGRRVVNKVSFRWSGGAQVTLDGKLVFLSTERQTRHVGSRNYVDGVMRIGGE